MYQVTIKNSDEEVVINAVSTHLEAPRVIGSIKQSINEIDSFTFTILPNNIGYNKIFSLTTLVEVLNIKTNKLEFKGRVLIAKQSMSEKGLFYKNVVCESELAYLMDSNQRYGEYHDKTVREFFQVIIDNHNRQVTEDKKFTLGTIDVEDDNDSLYKFLGYDKTLNTIKEKLIKTLGGELFIRYENGIRYLDYLKRVGTDCNTQIMLSRNLKTIEEEKDPTQIITRLVPLGKKLKKTVDGKEVDSEERLTIKSVNNNLDYIDDTEAVKTFGVIENSVMYDDVTVASNLYNKGLKYLKANNTILKKYNISALDLSIIGLDIDSIGLYNKYKVINLVMGIDEYLRVVEKTIDIQNPQNSSINVGDKFEDIKKYQIAMKKLLSQ